MVSNYSNHDFLVLFVVKPWLFIIRDVSKPRFKIEWCNKAAFPEKTCRALIWNKTFTRAFEASRSNVLKALITSWCSTGDTNVINDEVDIQSSILMLMLYNTACSALNGYCGDMHLGNKSQLCLSHVESKSAVSKWNASLVNSVTLWYAVRSCDRSFREPYIEEWQCFKEAQTNLLYKR